MDPVDVRGLDHERNVLLLDPPSTQQPLCSPDKLQWPWSDPAGKGVGGKEGGLERVT